MVGIPPKLLQKLRTILLRCGPFDKDSKLRAVFVDSRIALWRNNLPQAESPADRVDTTIDHLVNKHNSDGENGLVLFLQVLIDRVMHSDDSCYRDLSNISKALEKEVRVERDPQLDELKASINCALKILEHKFHIFSSSDKIFPDQCDFALNSLDELESEIDLISTLIPSQYQTRVPLANIQSQTKLLRYLLVEFRNSCPPGDQDKKQQIVSQIETIDISFTKINESL